MLVQTESPPTTNQPTEEQLRIDLACAFRWAARLNMHESIANHFSAAVSDDGRKFLLQRAGQHFSRVRASDLLLLDVDNPDTLKGDNAPDPSGWYLHGHLHQHLPHARCVLHVHAPWTLTLACLKDYEFLMLDQTPPAFMGASPTTAPTTDLHSMMTKASALQT